MIKVYQTVKRRGTGFTQKEWRAKQQLAWQDAGNFWHANILDKHFSSKSEREYQYQARKKRYQLRKLKTKHHRNPLVWSGRAHEMAKAIREVRSKSTEVKIVLHLPKYFYAFHKPGTKDRKGRMYETGQIDKARELMMVSVTDEKLVARETDRSLQQQIETDPVNERHIGT